MADGFSRVPGYLNTSSLGLPAIASLEALQARLAEWQRGDTEPHSFDDEVERSRRAYASLVDSPTSDVAILSQSSVAAGLVASSLAEGTRVLVAEEDFTSVLFPFLADKRLSVKVVPLANLLGEIGPNTDLVAVSAVQSADGRVLDLDALEQRARKVGARTFVDITQAAGWLPLQASRFDVTACSAYKYLCCPRGAAFLTVRPEARAWLVPRFANGFAASDRSTGSYGPPLRLAEASRRYDASPAWLCWVAAAPVLELLVQHGVERIHTHNTTLANELRARLRLPPAAISSTIVSLDDTNALERLKAAGVHAAGRAGRTRLSFHLYSTVADVDAVVAALT